MYKFERRRSSRASIPQYLYALHEEGKLDNFEQIDRGGQPDFRLVLMVMLAVCCLTGLESGLSDSREGGLPGFPDTQTAFIIESSLTN